MLLRKLVVVGLVGFVSLAANIATAEDAMAPDAALVGVESVSFLDPNQPLSDMFSLSISAAEAGRFSNLSPLDSRRSGDDARRYELAFIASGAAGGFDVAFAQRGGLGFNDQGDIERQSRASELRLGRGLREMPRNEPSGRPVWYIFAASEDEALVWRPGMRTEFGGAGSSFALQDRVEIGDIQAGITYEQNGWQASLAYVEREVSVRSGSRTFSQDEDFAGFTLTMRH
jgi:hypothetical protein